MNDLLMTPSRWQQISTCFEAAIDLPESQREAWLDAACVNDAPLRKAVAEMLLADLASRSRGPAVRLLDQVSSAGWTVGSRIGAYEIAAKLGAGGMGEVYLAERVDGAVRQQVAIKRLLGSHLHPELERRFLDERRFLARLQHPHIARFLDAGADARGQPYAVMEYVPGLQICDYLRQHESSIEQRLRLFLEVCDAVSHAHRQLIVHRDIKPANILVSADGHPKLLDFGIAKCIDASSVDGPAATRTAFELRAFSLQHAAPEQLRGEHTGTSCDVYALGVLLHELLTGAPPFELTGLAYGEAERRILELTPPPASSCPTALGFEAAVGWTRQLRGDLDRIVLHALEKAPEHRYGSVDALSDDIRRHLWREPISLRGQQHWYRAARFISRHRLTLSLSALAFLSLLGSSAMVYQQAQRATRERDLAVLARAQAESATSLLTRAFEGADPARNGGAELSARAVLEYAARDLARRRDVDDVQRAVLTGTLADVRRSLGDALGASALLDQVQPLLPRLPAIEASRLLGQTAQARLELGNPQGARASVAQALALLDASPSTARSKRQRAELRLIETRLLSAEGEPAQALKLLAALYQESRKLDEDGLRLQIAEAYANQLDGMGRGASAAAINREILDSLADADGDIIGRRVLGNLARWFRSQEQHATARTFADRYLQSTRRLYGENHRMFASALDLHARTVADGGELERADQEFQRSLELLSELGEQVPERTRCLARNNYVDFLLHRRQQPARAYQEAQATLQCARSAYPAGHLNIAFIAKLTGESLLALGRNHEAYTLLAEAEQTFARHSGPDVRGLTRAQTQLLLAQAAEANADIGAARQWLRAATPAISQFGNAELKAAAARLSGRLHPELATSESTIE